MGAFEVEESDPGAGVAELPFERLGRLPFFQNEV